MLLFLLAEDSALSGEERAGVTLALFDAFAPELNLDDSLALLLATAQRLLNVEQVESFVHKNTHTISFQY